ncbi:YcxB family protein [Acetanaerobacterium elongatum]|uniref:YcxB-like protein n=1 Tax=Acetanaerobacterium elongatum TaxID=258515 RepID=A0A1H0GKF0_9FIRM|nr:YcxB family protein [Acetanaerobacterium elongatum]SDO07348.1 hypothetical protein SAMN05192585_1521 [Acetanaerobacterium elongatum]
MDENIKENENEEQFQPLYIKFTLNPHEIYAAVKTAQFRRNRVLRMVQTVLLAIVFFLYIQAVWVDPTYVTGIILSILSLFVLAAVWLVPLFQARGAFKQASGQALDFEMEFDDADYSVTESMGESSLYYHETQAVETDALILLIVRRSKLFCIPKRAVEEQTLQEIRALLKDKLGDDYKGK